MNFNDYFYAFILKVNQRTLNELYLIFYRYFLNSFTFNFIEVNLRNLNYRIKKKG